jgi:hypothetical protein
MQADNSYDFFFKAPETVHKKNNNREVKFKAGPLLTLPFYEN